MLFVNLMINNSTASPLLLILINRAKKDLVSMKVIQRDADVPPCPYWEIGKDCAYFSYHVGCKNVPCIPVRAYV